MWLVSLLKPEFDEAEGLSVLSPILAWLCMSPGPVLPQAFPQEN